MQNDQDAPLIRWIAERLRYRDLPELIGVGCAIASLNKVEDEILRVLSDHFGSEIQLIPFDYYEVKELLDKHGLLDLSFSLPNGMLNDADAHGVDLLIDLGFVMTDEEARQFESVAALVGDNLDDPTLLNELKADLELDQTVLRVLLHAENPTLPGVFVIEDTCLTNAESVWIHRHFYW